MAALGAHLFVGLGTFWPLVIAGSYGVGALLAPRDKVDLEFSVDSGAFASATDLTKQLGILRRSADTRRIGDDANSILTRILDNLDLIVVRWSEVSKSVDQGYTVEKIIVEWLPLALQTYLNMPRTFAMTSRIAGQRSAHDELVDALNILDTETAKIRDGAYTRDSDALSEQSAFLRSKFSKSRLEI